MMSTYGAHRARGEMISATRKEEDRAAEITPRGDQVRRLMLSEKPSFVLTKVAFY